MSTYPEFARLVNEQLFAQDRTPSWLANRLGVHPSTVSRWLNYEARPGDPETVARIADILCVYEPAEREALLAAAGYGYQEDPPRSVASRSQQELPSGGSPQHQPPQAMINGKVHNFVENLPPLSTQPGQEQPPFLVPSFPVHGVHGRDAALTQISQLLALDQKDATHVPPVALLGMGGIGKTTLAIALGRLDVVSDLFPDGVLWTAVGPHPTIRNLLDDWGRALGVNLAAERDEEACQDRLRSVLHHRRVLLIVDDLWEVRHGEAFMVAGPHCRLLLTTRESPVAYTLATRDRCLRLDVLTPEAALELLYRLAPEAVMADVENAKRLCERVEYLPLALTLAGRLLAMEADVPTRMQRLLGELVERREARLQLLQTEGRLGLHDEQPVSLQAMLNMSIGRLSRTDQERFAMFGRLRGGAFGVGYRSGSACMGMLHRGGRDHHFQLHATRPGHAAGCTVLDPCPAGRLCCRDAGRDGLVNQAQGNRAYKVAKLMTFTNRNHSLTPCSTPGSYILIFHLREPLSQIKIGKLGVFNFAPGTWLYCGSAHGSGGLRARLHRHLRSDAKALHWHIDYLTAHISPADVIFTEQHERTKLECRWPQALLRQAGFTVPIPGFGNGDCRRGCPAHLVYTPDFLALEELRQTLGF